MDLSDPADSLASVQEVSDLYRQLAIGRTRTAIQALEGIDHDRLTMLGAHMLEQTAAVLACITALLSIPGGRVAQRLEGHIAELLMLAATLEQTADLDQLPDVVE